MALKRKLLRVFCILVSVNAGAEQATFSTGDM